MATQLFKRCLVQGASRGIGLEYTRQLLAKPAVELVVATSRHPDLSRDLQQLKHEHGDRLLCLPMDLAQPASIAAAAADLENQRGSIEPFHFLINCSGFLHSAQDKIMPERKLADVTYEMLQRNFQVIRAMSGPVLRY